MTHRTTEEQKMETLLLLVVVVIFQWMNEKGERGRIVLVGIYPLFLFFWFFSFSGSFVWPASKEKKESVRSIFTQNVQIFHFSQVFFWKTPPQYIPNIPTIIDRTRRRSFFSFLLFVCLFVVIVMEEFFFPKSLQYRSL